MKFKELKKHIASKQFFKAYYITGDDAFLVNSSVNQFKNIIVDLPDMNVSEFSDQKEARPILDSCQTLPLMSDKRLVLVYNFMGDTTILSDYLKSHNPSTILVFVSEKLQENFSKIINDLEIIDCTALEESFIIHWINSSLASTNTKIETSAVRLLIEYCSGNMTRITRECEKLGVYRLDDTITKTDIEQLVTADTEYKIFELSEAVANKNTDKASSVLKNMLSANIPPVTLIGMIYSHFRRLLYCLINKNDDTVAKKLGVKDYAVKKSTEQARKYSPIKLKQICDDFHFSDRAIKSGEINDKLALEMFILKTLIA